MKNASADDAQDGHRDTDSPRLDGLVAAGDSMVSRRTVAFQVIVSLVVLFFYMALYQMFTHSLPGPFVGMAMVMSGLVLVFGIARFVWGVRWSELRSLK